MAQKKKKSGSWKLIVILAFIVAGGFFFFEVFGPNTTTFTQDEFLYVHTGATFDDMLETLKESNLIRDMKGFEVVAKALKLPDHVHAGKYRIKAGMSSYNIVRMLRSGKQEPVKLVINKLRTRTDFVRLVSTNLEADSTRMRELLYTPAFLDSFGVDTGTFMAIILPDTYEFYWNTPSEKVVSKIYSNYKRFWNADRRKKAANHGITTLQAITIASIVEEETNKSSDKPLVASVYLNRLKKNMKLQADPTVKFAIGDFSIKRITGAMLDYNSPYNTYMYAGLPPGPICTPAVSTLNAVLNSPKTSYLYFCASASLDGSSAFASDYSEQLRNAVAYHKALDARGIH